MDDPEFGSALRRKLVEEAQEAPSTPREDLVTELADLMKVVYAQIRIGDNDLGDVEKVRRTRAEQRNGFSERLLLEWTEEGYDRG